MKTAIISATEQLVETHRALTAKHVELEQSTTRSNPGSAWT